MAGFLCSLASGSLGNALLVATGRTAVLVDAGLSARRLRASLRTVGVAPEDIEAVLVTHTHRDHFSSSVAAFCLAHRIPVYSTRDNLSHLAYGLGGFADLLGAGLAQPVDGRPLALGDLSIETFDVPHDSDGQCLGFRMTVGSLRRGRAVALATDLGHVPSDALASFVDASVLVMESNHDPEMLRSSGRPEDLIRRIAGPRGHLSNDAAAEALAEVVGRSHPGRVKHVVLAHLSRDCNTPRLALAAQAHLARRPKESIHLSAATQYDVGPRIEL